MNHLHRPLACASLVLALTCLNASAAGTFAASAEEARPLPPGSKAPAFTARRVAGSDYRFDPDAMRAPLLLVFYRGGWCGYCNMHLAELRDAVPELKAMGYEVLFLSADRPEILYSSLEEKNRDLDYTLLSDSKLEAAAAYGIAFKLDAETLADYEKYGVDLEAASGETHHALPVPAVFVIGRDGVIRYSHANPDITVRLKPAEVTAAAKTGR
jgi:peroxiredoxin